MRWFRAILAVLGCAALLPGAVIAGTTGGIVGRVVDAATQAPVAGATVTAISPSQSATATTDAVGAYRFLTLAPDSYTLTVTKTGYDQVTQPGLSVFADQVQTFNVPMVKTIRTIARVTSRAAANLLKPGTTSDVYSINASGQKAAGSLIGPGGLSNAYGAIQSAPGVAIDQGEAGWFQMVHIRGGDIDQVGYEMDGIPVNRVYDNAPQTMLSSLGSQEVEVYTGGALASADAQGISGYVNQVVKTGTFPGYAEGNLSVGTPAFYHQASVEAGGSTPDRLFSYYVGIGGANQDLRYVDSDLASAYPKHVLLSRQCRRSEYVCAGIQRLRLHRRQRYLGRQSVRDAARRIRHRIHTAARRHHQPTFCNSAS
ncbi:MAG: carboxypeptidase regulatory-like domain-containing protein [Candidatus Tumulicola sp.]